jgi:hypothetical protein
MLEVWQKFNSILQFPNFVAEEGELFFISRKDAKAQRENGRKRFVASLFWGIDEAMPSTLKSGVIPPSSRNAGLRKTGLRIKERL